MNPTARSLAKLKAEGWTCTIVERWVPASGAGYHGPILRKDAFGFGDLLCCKVGVIGATLVQVTSGSNVSARLSKIKESAEAAIFLAAGNRLVVHGWSKMGKAGKRKTWQCRELVAEFTNDVRPHPTPVQNHS